MAIMNMFRKVTGGAADVELTVENAVRGQKAKVTVNVRVGSAALKVKRVYVRLVANEGVDIPRYSAPSQPGATGGSNIIHVRSTEQVSSQEVTIAEGQELAAETTAQFTGEIAVPSGLPSFTGQTIRMEWKSLAGLDVAWSTDPSSGWIDVNVT